jgi:DNA (cytosine-5)-methyltransferase 1
VHVLALCAGAGGLELGLKLAEPTATLVCAIEGEAYVASLLVAHMEAGRLDPAPVWSDVIPIHFQKYTNLVVIPDRT